MCPYDELYKLPDISFVGGGVKKINLNVFSSKGQILDASNVTGNFLAVSATQKGSAPVISKQMSKVPGKLNVFSVTLEPEDTKDLYGKYIYQVSIAVDGTTEEPRQGNLYIGYNIDRN